MIDITNHYWIIGGSTTEVYSSASNTLVPATDQTYVGWAAANTVSPIASEEELADVMKQQSTLPAWLFNAASFIQPAVDTYSNDQLAAYTAEARRKKMQGDIVVNGLTFSTDPLTYGSLNSAFIYVQQKTTDTFSWKLPDGGFITLNKDDITALHDAANDFGQNCFICEDTTLDKIEAGTVTDLAAIDAEFAAVSNTFTGLRDAKDLKRRHVPKKQ